jgi:hypothetical protein
MSILEDNLVSFRNRLVWCQWNTHGRGVNRNLDFADTILARRRDHGIDQALYLSLGHAARPTSATDAALRSFSLIDKCSQPLGLGDLAKAELAAI